MVSFIRNVDIDLPPAELYRLARVVLQVRPDRVQICVIGGTRATWAQPASCTPTSGRPAQ